MKKLYKLKDKKKIFGVCAGISDITGFDVTNIRIVFSLLCLFKGFGVFFYFILAFILPDKSELG